MSETPTVVIRFKDVSRDETVHEDLEGRVRTLLVDFPDTTRFEINLEPDGVGVRIQAHMSGKNTQIAAHAGGPDVRSAADQLFHRVKQQLRRLHDKRTFQHRREAQKASPKH
jgi:ribosome-associated translation inhibitor RaiA